MLPFLKPRKQVGVIIEQRKPDGEIKEQGDEKEGLKMAAEDILRAINNKDAEALADALKAAFEICDAYPHEEGPHLNESEQE